MRPMKFGVGQPVRRVEDERLIRGGGDYTDDRAPDRALQSYVLRSPYAHARFTFTDLEAARAMKGVKLILTAADVAHLGEVQCQAPLPNGDGTKGPVKHIPLLANGVAKHVGDAVAFIVAESMAIAKDAAELVAIDWVSSPVVVEIPDALAKGAAMVWDDAPGNIAYDTAMGDKAKVEGIFAKAHKTVRLEIINNRLITNYMETRACIAEYDAPTKSFTLTVGSQGVHGLRDTIATHILKIKPEKLRVVTPDVGGGFGTKSFNYREYALAAEAARVLKRPVKWTAERSDHFVSDAHGRDSVVVAEAAMDRSGRFLAMRFDWMGNLGAYMHQYGPYIHYLGATMLTGTYATPALFARVRGIFTNTVPVDAYRGAGRPEAAYVLERLVDYAAREMGIEGHEMRRRNFIKAAAMPYKTPIGDRTYDVGDFEGHMAKALEVADWRGFKERVKASKKAGKLRGIGLGSYIECTAWGSGEAVTMHLDADGGVTLYSGTQSNGQGHATAYAQFASQVLDLPLSKIRVIQGDTARVSTGHGTGGSRSIPVGGVSAYVSATNLAEKIKHLAAEKLEAGVADLEIGNGAVTVTGTDRKISFAEIAALPSASKEAVTAEGEFTPPNATYPNGTHVAELEVDPATGIVEIINYTICDDFGTTVNPMLLAGQVHGGVAQGLGQAFMERTVYDKDGQLVTASFMDYCMPRADDMPSFHFETRNVPSTTNPLGIKGAGEAGSIGSCPAVMNALVDALDRAAGVRHIDMPATPEVVWRALQGA
jgi:aerobic carbon-monoxide dehydrogenase large subunit